MKHTGTVKYSLHLWQAFYT